MSTSYSESKKNSDKGVKNIFRAFKSKNFTTISTVPLYDVTLSMKAKALWVFGMAHPHDWTFHLSEMQTHFKEGIKAIYGAFNELAHAGYAARFSYKEQLGKSKRWLFSGNEYVFFEEKRSPEEIEQVKEEFKKCFPQRHFGHAESSRAEKRTLLDHDSSVDHDSSLEERECKKKKAQAPAPSSSSKKIERATHVVTTAEEHDKLVKEHGEERTQRAYQELSDWKLNTPQSRWKKSDYLSLRKWVFTALDEADAKKSNLQKTKSKNVEEFEDYVEANREWFDTIKNSYCVPKGQAAMVNSNFVQFSSSSGHEQSEKYYFTSKKFRDLVMHEMNKRGFARK